MFILIFVSVTWCYIADHPISSWAENNNLILSIHSVGQLGSSSALLTSIRSRPHSAGRLASGVGPAGTEKDAEPLFPCDVVSQASSHMAL